MSNTLTVQDPDEGTSEVATETRKKLQQWADRYLPADQEEGIKALDDSVVKALRARGVEFLSYAAQRLNASSLFNPPTEFGKLLAAFSTATHELTEQYPADGPARDLSHAFEGLVREFHKQFFQAGMKWNLHAEWLALASLYAPHRSTAQQDTVFYKHCYGGLLGGSRSSYQLGAYGTNEWEPAWRSLANDTQERFSGILDWLLTQCGVEIGEEGRAWWSRRLTKFNVAGAQVHYMDADGPWVAGFLNLEDACKLRFRRVRLGAYYAEQGMPDGDVRARVEKAKQQVAGAVFEAYPNDCLWEDVYTTGPSSCMSDSADEYQCWDGHHPVTAYSSSYHGSGDNSLVLLVSRDGDGNIDGRGILNLQKGTIVRWYGDNVAERVLKRAGVNVSDRGNMEGSWLALIEQGKRFIHPYVDGHLSYGRVDGDRVYIEESGSICIQETGGSSYQGETEYCIDTEEYEDADECEYQPFSGNYISNDCDSWRCPVIGEYARQYDRSSMDIHGVMVEVSDVVRYDTGRFLTQEDNGVWTIDDPEMRRQFCEEYEVDEDEPEEDEEAA